MKEVSDERADQLLNHYVLFKKVGELRVSRHQLSKCRHYRGELALVVKLLEEGEALLALQDDEVFAHHNGVEEAAMDAVGVRQLVEHECLLEVDHEQVEVLLRDEPTYMRHVDRDAHPLLVPARQIGQELGDPAGVLLDVSVLKEVGETGVHSH